MIRLCLTTNFCGRADNSERALNEETKKAFEALKGSWSTKIKAVLETVIEIKNDDPTAKSLVFSTWGEVLDILAEALVENNIQFAALHAQGKFKRNLEKFKVQYDEGTYYLSMCSAWV